MPNIGVFALAFIGAALASGGLIWVLRPLWRHYALAKPNARSSHTAPTPQGGGIVVIAVTIAAVSLATIAMPVAHAGGTEIALVLAATVLLAIVGAIDDVHAIGVVPRLLLQTIAVGAVIASLPADLRIVAFLPWWVERVLLVIGGLWFVNLVNFMDGLDWMTVAETVPVTIGLALFGLLGALPPSATAASCALCGAMIGFAPFNRPVARLFLGDVGSLPVGLLLGWLLVLLAGGGHLAAALLLPLYYLADTTITLLRRGLAGEEVTQAHRNHFYQRAMDRGFSISEIVGRVFLLNAALAAFAGTTLLWPSPLLDMSALVCGCALVGLLLYRLDHGLK